MTESIAQRDPIERLAEEFLGRLRRGEHPKLGDYTAAHPELADEIRDLFPALVMMEQVKPDDDVLSPSPLSESDAFPNQLGDYRILREVARGGMGVVYEAEQQSLGRHVALKVLPAQRNPDAIRLLRFRREARSAARLHHSNIVPVFDVGSCDGVHYYAMQFIHGQGLDEVLQELRRLRCGEKPTDAPARALTESLVEGLQSGQFPGAPVLPGIRSQAPRAEASAILTEPASHYFRSVARLGVQAAEALAYAHGQHVLHRDVKPSNLLLDCQGTLWLTDFGLAKDDSEDLTRTGDIVGTIRYMAPERFQGISDERTDIYALGVTLYEMLALRPAFLETDRVRLVHQVASEEPPRPRALDPSIPRDLETVVLKAIEKEPGRRYQSATELAEDLRRFLTDRPILARRASWAEQLWRWCRRNRGPAAAAAAIFLLLIAGITGTSIGLIRAERARQDQVEQRRVAERERDQKEEARKQAVANLIKASEAANRFLTRFAQEDLLDVPQMELVRHRLLLDALEFYKGFLQQHGDDPLIRREAALAYGRYGRICWLVGRYTEAEEALAQSVSMLEDLSLNVRPAADLLYAQAGFYAELGSLSVYTQSIHRKSKAEHALRRALRIAEGVAQESPGRSDFRELVSSCCLELSQCLIRTQPLEARELVLRVIAAEEKVNSTPVMLAKAWNFLGIIHRESRNMAEAEKAFRRALSVVERLSADFPTIQSYQDGLAGTLTNLALVLSSRRSFTEAEAVYRRAMAIFRKAVDRYPDVPGYRHELARIQCELVPALMARKQHQEAEANCREAIALFERNAVSCRTVAADEAAMMPDRSRSIRLLVAGVDESDSMNFGSNRISLPAFRAEHGLIHSRTKLVAVLAVDGRRDEAESILRELTARMEAVEAELVELPQHRYSLASLQASLALKLMEIGRHKDAEKPCRRGLELFAQLLAESPEDAEYLERVAGEHFRLGKILTALDRPGEAAESYARAVPHYGKLAAEKGPRQDAFRFAQASSLNNVAWILATAADPKSHKPAEAAAAATKATELAPKTGGFWNTRGVAHYRAGDWKAAIAAFEKSRELRNGGDSFDWFFLALAHWKLGDKEKAREWHGQAVQWMEKKQSKDEDLLRFRAEAEELIQPEP
jgi:serine/threonine protein kinase